jgi:phage baseplate assembly protein gpV
MSKKLIVGDEVYTYPDTGDINYGEAATGWAVDMTSIAAEVRGPGDIPTTETTLIGATDGTHVTGTITNMNFDTAYVQSITLTGFITRTYSDATPTQVERFTIQGAYDGTEINYDTDYTGSDTELEFTVSGGQFGFKYLEIADTDTVTVKFSAKALVDESFFE